MHFPKLCLIATSAERAQLAALSNNGRTPQQVARRTNAVLGLIERQRPRHIALTLGVSRNQVYLWTKRYIAGGVSTLVSDASRPPGRAPVPPDKVAAIVNATLTSTPPGGTHWSSPQMARAQGVSDAMVRKIWRQHRLQPHRVERFKFSKDPRFVEKLRDVVGLYLHPPDKAVVSCVDAKPNIQALDRTPPVLPLQPGLPEQQTHDYRRHGTTTLFAALRILDGLVIGECRARPRAKDFVRFLKRLDAETPVTLDLHLIVDNASTHKSAVKRWLARHPRFHFHFTPTNSSWLNLVERWFAEITRQRILRGTFESVRRWSRPSSSTSPTTTKPPSPSRGRRMPTPFWRKSTAPSLVPNRHAQHTSTRDFVRSCRPQAGSGGIGRLGVPNTISVMALTLRLP